MTARLAALCVVVAVVVGTGTAFFQTTSPTSTNFYSPNIYLFTGDGTVPEYFGFSIAYRGRTLAVGAPVFNGTITATRATSREGAGRVYVFTNVNPSSKSTRENTACNYRAFFGTSVAIVDPASGTVIASAPGCTSGEDTVPVYAPAGTGGDQEIQWGSACSSAKNAPYKVTLSQGKYSIAATVPKYRKNIKFSLATSVGDDPSKLPPDMDLYVEDAEPRSSNVMTSSSGVVWGTDNRIRLVGFYAANQNSPYDATLTPTSTSTVRLFVKDSNPRLCRYCTGETSTSCPADSLTYTGTSAANWNIWYSGHLCPRTCQLRNTKYTLTVVTSSDSNSGTAKDVTFTLYFERDSVVVVKSGGFSRGSTTTVYSDQLGDTARGELLSLNMYVESAFFGDDWKWSSVDVAVPEIGKAYRFTNPQNSFIPDGSGFTAYIASTYAITQSYIWKAMSCPGSEESIVLTGTTDCVLQLVVQAYKSGTASSTYSFDPPCKSSHNGDVSISTTSSTSGLVPLTSMFSSGVTGLSVAYSAANGAAYVGSPGMPGSGTGQLSEIKIQSNTAAGTTSVTSAGTVPVYSDAPAATTSVPNNAMYASTTTVGELIASSAGDEIVVGSPRMTSPSQKLGLVGKVEVRGKGLPAAAPLFEAWGDQAGALFGSALCIGDFNGDNIPDLLVGAPNYIVRSLSDVGRVFIFAGTARSDIFRTRVYIDGIAARGRFGFAIGNAGKAGRTGCPTCDDFVVGAPRANNGAGAVYVYHGIPNLSDSVNGASVVTLAQTVTDSDPSGLFGYSFGVGDAIDNVGSPDIVVGQPGWNGGRGRVVTLLGVVETDIGVGVTAAGGVAKFLVGSTMDFIVKLTYARANGPRAKVTITLDSGFPTLVPTVSWEGTPGGALNCNAPLNGVITCTPDSPASTTSSLRVSYPALSTAVQLTRKQISLSAAVSLNDAQTNKDIVSSNDAASLTVPVASEVKMDISFEPALTATDFNPYIAGNPTKAEITTETELLFRTFVVSNKHPTVTAFNVAVTIVLPDGLSYNAGTATITNATTNAALSTVFVNGVQTIKLSIQSLPPNQGFRVAGLKVSVNTITGTGSVGVVPVTMAVTTTSDDTSPASSKSYSMKTPRIAVSTTATLGLQLFTDADQVTAGLRSSGSVVVTNSAAGVAWDITVNVTMDDRYVLRQGRPRFLCNNGVRNAAAKTVTMTCNLARLTNYGTATLDFTMDLASDAHLRNAALLTTPLKAVVGWYDSRPLQTSSVVSKDIAIVASSQINLGTLFLVADHAPFRPGGTFVARLSTVNEGPSNASSVSVAFTYPAAQVTLGNLPSNCAKGSGNTVTCALGGIAPLSAATLAVPMAVAPGITYTASAVEISATATASETDPKPEDNTEKSSFPVDFTHDLSILSVSAPIAARRVGQTASYRFVLANSGVNPSPASGCSLAVTVTPSKSDPSDPLPVVQPKDSDCTSVTNGDQSVKFTCPLTRSITVGADRLAYAVSFTLKSKGSAAVAGALTCPDLPGGVPSDSRTSNNGYSNNVAFVEYCLAMLSLRPIAAVSVLRPQYVVNLRVWNRAVDVPPCKGIKVLVNASSTTSRINQALTNDANDMPGVSIAYNSAQQATVTIAQLAQQDSISLGIVFDQTDLTPGLAVTVGTLLTTTTPNNVDDSNLLAPTQTMTVTDATVSVGLVSSRTVPPLAARATNGYVKGALSTNTTLARFIFVVKNYADPFDDKTGKNITLSFSMSLGEFRGFTKGSLIAASEGRAGTPADDVAAADTTKPSYDTSVTANFTKYIFVDVYDVHNVRHNCTVPTGDGSFSCNVPGIGREEELQYAIVIRAWNFPRIASYRVTTAASLSTVRNSTFHLENRRATFRQLVLSVQSYLTYDTVAEQQNSITTSKTDTKTIIIAVVCSVVGVAVIVLVLWKLGFFKRKPKPPSLGDFGSDDFGAAN